MIWDPLKDSGLNPGAQGFYSYEIPAGKRVKLDFSTLPGTWWENAIVVYSRQTLEPIAERGNYFRSLDDYISDNSGSDEPTKILLTAWHKNSPPKASVPWEPSKRNKIESGDNLIIVGWSDDGVVNSFFANITARIIILD